MRKNRYSNQGLISIKEHLDYNPSNGLFTWLTDRKKVKSGDIAGTYDKDGYLIITFNRKIYKAHRLAWFYVNGFFPQKTIDHINRNRSDNRIENLREATHLQQMKNISNSITNKSGFPGVFWSKSAKKWQAQFSFNKRRYHVGLFDDALEASMKRIEMKESMSRQGSHSP